MAYWTVRFILLVASKFVYRIKVTGVENIPKNGAFILCSNHIHSYDPAMIAISVKKRRLTFMAKKELFQTPIKARFFRAVGAFPVDRNAADLTSYRNAMAMLKAEHGLVVFSQGTRMKTLNVNTAKGGVALFGVKSKAPILPVGISGTYKAFSYLYINFGKPITLEEYHGKRLKTEQTEEIMSKIMLEVEKLVQ
ncbi:MAG: 1-acyl-sn-glycerol-3-phosphate acyltransferase [Defluviitaleaceae bacterium]|nr:1-acyl-sn-glycerol-3-phosphate acyltransferase [Defluviitaleaceae bacterium]